jgi:hypothetical protein
MAAITFRPMIRRRQMLAAMLALAAARNNVFAEEAAKPDNVFVPSEEFQTFVTGLAREHIPQAYERKKNWGATTRVLDGVDVDLDGLRLDTKRRWKDAYHGTWQYYKLTQINPDENLTVRIEGMREVDGGQVLCKISATARMHCFGRQNQYERGVQIYSVSAEAEAFVKLIAVVSLKPRLDPSSFPPDLVMRAEVKGADLEIHDFKLHRVSQFDGPVIKSLSHSTQKLIEDVVEEKKPQLVEKINQKLEKEKDKLRLSWADVLKTPWGDLAEKLTGE